MPIAHLRLHLNIPSCQLPWKPVSASPTVGPVTMDWPLGGAKAFLSSHRTEQETEAEPGMCFEIT